MRGVHHAPARRRVSIRSPSEEGLKPATDRGRVVLDASFNPQPLRRGAEAARRAATATLMARFQSAAPPKRG